MPNLTLTLEDDYGRQTTRRYGMETQVLLADYAASIAAFMQAMDDVTDLACVKAMLNIPVTNDLWAVTADANVDVGGTATGRIVDGNGKKASMKIPGVKPALVGSDGSIAISGVVATWLAEFEDGADFNLSDGEQIETWLKASLDK